MSVLGDARWRYDDAAARVRKRARAEKRFARIGLAYAVLKDKVRRRIYLQQCAASKNLPETAAGDSSTRAADSDAHYANAFRALVKAESFSADDCFDLCPYETYDAFFSGVDPEDREYLLLNGNAHMTESEGSGEESEAECTRKDASDGGDDDAPAEVSSKRPPSAAVKRKRADETSAGHRNAKGVESEGGGSGKEDDEEALEAEEEILMATVHEDAAGAGRETKRRKLATTETEDAGLPQPDVLLAARLGIPLRRPRKPEIDIFREVAQALEQSKCIVNEESSEDGRAAVLKDVPSNPDASGKTTDLDRREAMETSNAEYDDAKGGLAASATSEAKKDGAERDIQSNDAECAAESDADCESESDSESDSDSDADSDAETDAKGPPTQIGLGGGLAKRLAATSELPGLPQRPSFL
jgi:curved DNA-binding protein CbpA